RMGAEGVWMHDNLLNIVLALVAQGRIDEAAATFEQLRPNALHRGVTWGEHHNDVFGVLVQGEVLRELGRPAAAVSVIRDALEHPDEDWAAIRAPITFSLAKALRDDGAENEAAATGREALAIYERKGDVARTAKVRAFLDT